VGKLANLLLGTAAIGDVLHRPGDALDGTLSVAANFHLLMHDAGLASERQDAMIEAPLRRLGSRLPQ